MLINGRQSLGSWKAGPSCLCHLALGVFGYAVSWSVSGQRSPHPFTSGSPLPPSARPASPLLSSPPTEAGTVPPTVTCSVRGEARQRALAPTSRSADAVRTPTLPGTRGQEEFTSLSTFPTSGWGPSIASQSREGVLWGASGLFGQPTNTW